MIFVRKLTQWLVGSSIFGQIEQVVLGVMDLDKTGEEKKQIVLSKLKVLGLGLSKSLTNLAIEVSVSYYKN